MAGYHIIKLDKDGAVVEDKMIEPWAYPITKLRKDFEDTLEPLYEGKVETLIIERINNDLF